jgi:hypothetical protein
LVIVFGSLEGDLDRAGVPVGVDELQAERGRRRRQRRSPLSDIPERTGSFAHDSFFPGLDWPRRAVKTSAIRAVADVDTAASGNWAPTNRPVRPSAGVFTGWERDQVMEQVM